MSLLQSALDFLAGPGSLGGAAGRDQSDFVGQTVELGELRLRVRRVLAEGGFAFVYEAQDLGSGREYALKRLLSNEEEKNRAIIQEVCFLKKLSGHPNIVQFCSAASIGKEESDTGQAEFLLLTELCKGLPWSLSCCFLTCLNSHEIFLGCSQGTMVLTERSIHPSIGLLIIWISLCVAFTSRRFRKNRVSSHLSPKTAEAVMQ
uniref:Protein kinase domain-containing protein n=1 Tax=Jaculus jaculus TaxID=51337 RepID=A0A8C5KCE8_JACJA